MAEYEITHVAVAPPQTPGNDLVNNVATIIGKSPFETSLLLTGDIPKIIARYDSLPAAEAIVRNLRGLGLAAMACRDTELRQPPLTFTAQSLEFRDKEVLFRNSTGSEKRTVKDNVFLILSGRLETSVEVEKTTTKTKFSLTGTLLTGGFPVWRKVEEKTTSRSVEETNFVRLYERALSAPVVEIRQREMNYAFLGAVVAPSSFTNFGTLVVRLREAFPQAIFDDRLSSPSGPGSANQQWPDMATNCHLIYLFHLLSHGLDPGVP